MFVHQVPFEMRPSPKLRAAIGTRDGFLLAAVLRHVSAQRVGVLVEFVAFGAHHLTWKIARLEVVCCRLKHPHLKLSTNITTKNHIGRYTFSCASSS